MKRKNIRMGMSFGMTDASGKKIGDDAPIRERER